MCQLRSFPDAGSEAEAASGERPGCPRSGRPDQLFAAPEMVRIRLQAFFSITVAEAGFHTASPTSGRFPYAFVYLVTAIIFGFLSCIKAI
jgi:hypothetical protein